MKWLSFGQFSIFLLLSINTEMHCFRFIIHDLIRFFFFHDRCKCTHKTQPETKYSAEYELIDTSSSFEFKVRFCTQTTNEKTNPAKKDGKNIDSM